MPVAINNEAGTLAFLGNKPIKEIEGNGFGGYIDDGTNILAINGNIVLLVGIKRFVTGCLSNPDLFRRGIDRAKRAGTVGCVIKKSSNQQSCNCNRTSKLHGISA